MFMSPIQSTRPLATEAELNLGEMTVPLLSMESLFTRSHHDGSGRPTVLVVDHVDKNRLYLRMLLEAQGYHVLSAANGEEALEVMQTADLSLVLMDVIMPGMSGLEVTRHYRQWESRRSKHTPIIAMTTGGIPEGRKLCLCAGMDDYLVTPFIEANFLRKLRLHGLTRA